jgi:tetratricopeptide (TPR) repeat protein
MPSAPELQQRAIEYAKAGDFGPQALATNLELSKLAPTNEGALTRLSRCYMEGGQLDEATATLDAVLQLNPQNTIARSLQMEVSRRRAISAAPIKRSRSTESKPKRSEPRPSATVGGFGRSEFATLGQLAPTAALDALTARVEPLLMALNDRPFAARAVDARNRAGLSGARLFRRNTLAAGGPGHLYAFHQGGRFEPQLNVGFLSRTPWGRDAIRAGLGFNLAAKSDDPSDVAGRERALAAFARFQQLASSAWRSFLTQWMATNAGFLQFGHTPPSTELMPNDAIARLIDLQTSGDVEWVFFGRWLFMDRSNDAEVMADGRRLVAWTESSFTDLLPVWTNLYRS